MRGMIPAASLASTVLYLTAAVLATWDLASARRKRHEQEGAESNDEQEIDPCLEGQAAQQSKRKWTAAVVRRAVAAGAVAGATAYAVQHVFRSSRRRVHVQNSACTKVRSAEGLRIPLKDVVRFRERSWFIEELENAREGDPNSMLRLAKMYLYGQGCERNVNIAVEWLRKARGMGVPCSLDELLTAEDLSQYKAEAGRPPGPARAGTARAGLVSASLSLAASVDNISLPA